MKIEIGSIKLEDVVKLVAEGNLNEKEAEIGLLDNINNDGVEEGQKEEEGLEDVELLLSGLTPEERKGTAKLFLLDILMEIMKKYKASKGKAAIRAVSSIFSSLSIKPNGEFNKFSKAVDKATDQFLIEFEEELGVERMLNLEEVEEVGSNRGGSEG